LTFVFLAVLLPAGAQDFALRWIGCPDAGEGRHVLFRQTYLTDTLPAQALLTVATTGWVKVYVNQCNVGTGAFYPYRTEADARPHAVTLDVTPYLRADTNVVAVMYAPAWPHRESRQVAVSLFGRRADGSRFSYTTDSSWVCRLAPSGWLADGSGEWKDGARHDPAWNAATYAVALWAPATEAAGPADSLGVVDRFGYAAWRVAHVRGMRYFDLLGDSVAYEFGQGFIGRLRLTLRSASPGECLTYGSNVYFCSGEMDEQATPEFLVSPLRRVVVSGDSRFRRDQIVNIEAVEMAPATFSSDSYPRLQP
jgi:hypothetical protein